MPAVQIKPREHIEMNHLIYPQLNMKKERTVNDEQVISNEDIPEISLICPYSFQSTHPVSVTASQINGWTNNHSSHLQRPGSVIKLSDKTAEYMKAP